MKSVFSELLALVVMMASGFAVFALLYMLVG